MVDRERRIDPAWKCEMKLAMPTKAIGVEPDKIAFAESPPPRNGTRTMSMSRVG